MRAVAAFVCAIALVCFDVMPSHADKRVALVMGNAAYQSAPQLRTPANDAAAIATMFRSVGFTVLQRTDLDRISMQRALLEFSNQARDADTVVVFYSGHGIEVNGVNYLLPIDTKLASAIDVEYEAMSFNRLLEEIGPASRFRLFILDAGRNNPFHEIQNTRSAFELSRGLVRQEVATSDTLVAYSTKPGSVTLDGDGPTSPYTTALLQHLVTPGLDVRLALGRVRDQVLRDTRGRQEPVVFGSVSGTEVSLAPKKAEPVAAPPAGEAERAWTLVQSTNSVPVLEAFIKTFGDTFYGALAKARLEEVRKSQTAAPPAAALPLPSTSQIPTALSTLGYTERRVALVVGNADYQYADKLFNPITDARRVKEMLAKLGFDVTYAENATKKSLERTIGRFAGAAKDSDVALVFFAGHGATFGETPYVVPIDAEFSNLDQMPYELVPVETLIGELRKAKGLRIAILDACRDNNAERELRRTGARGGPDMTRGLGRVKNPDGLILVYATQYLSTAADGAADGDSPFTAALLNNMATPGLDVTEMFVRVGQEVIANTKGKQRPEVSISLFDRYALVPAR